MFYLIQNNILRDTDAQDLMDTLKELDLEYEPVNVIPSAEDFSCRTTRKDVFVYGSVRFAKAATAMDWKPGSFYGGAHDYDVYSMHYGEHLLNNDSQVFTAGDTLEWASGEEKFIRPTKEAKVFTGSRFTQTKWEDFITQSLLSNTGRIRPDTKIQVASPKRIFKEARVWIVGGRVVTSSYYRFHGDMEFEETVPTEGLAFAQRMADIFQVAPAFVMDICLAVEGWRIVEVNCINSAGFYKADLPVLVRSLEKELT